MRFKLQAGAELDLLNREEMREELDAWSTELRRGIRFRQISGRTDRAGGVYTLTVDGPREGFMWAVTRLFVSGGGVVAGTDVFSVYVDEVTPSKLVESGLTRGQRWDVPTLQLDGGSVLIVSGVGTGAGTDVTASGQAVEIPMQAAWQLL
jgi:hypothetical protein